MCNVYEIAYIGTLCFLGGIGLVLIAGLIPHEPDAAHIVHEDAATVEQEPYPERRG